MLRPSLIYHKIQIPYNNDRKGVISNCVGTLHEIYKEKYSKEHKNSDKIDSINVSVGKTQQ